MRTSEQNVAFLEAKIDRLTNQLSKVENDRIVSLQREVSILRQLLDLQNVKLDKVTSLLTDLVTQMMSRRGKLPGEDEVLELRAQGETSEADDDDESVLRSIRAFQESVNVSDLQRHGIQQQINHHVNHLQTQPHMAHQISMQRRQHLLNQTTASDHLGRALDNNMDPELHHVSTVVPNDRHDILSRQVQPQQQPQQRQARRQQEAGDEMPIKQKTRGKKRKRGGVSEEINSILSEEPVSSKKDQSTDQKSDGKVHIEFIHNPTTVREIYDEFFKGFKGQGPLCEMDEKYGKLNWRGDSRSKESKRYQRRKRLCDAIKRGSYKYNKTDDEMIEYLENFRKEKSLTWVMNGHIPDDLKE